MSSFSFLHQYICILARFNGLGIDATAKCKDKPLQTHDEKTCQKVKLEGGSDFEFEEKINITSL